MQLKLKQIKELETHIQQNIVKLYNYKYKHLFILESCPAQAQRLRSGYQRMQAEGYRPGTSDLKAYNANKIICIEVKTRTGKQSDHQKEYQSLVESHLIPYYIVRSVEEFEKVVLKEFIH